MRIVWPASEEIDTRKQCNTWPKFEKLSRRHKLRECVEDQTEFIDDRAPASFKALGGRVAHRPRYRRPCTCVRLLSGEKFSSQRRRSVASIRKFARVRRQVILRPLTSGPAQPPVRSRRVQFRAVAAARRDAGHDDSRPQMFVTFDLYTIDSHFTTTQHCLLNDK